MELGEQLLWRTQRKNKLAKIRSRWEYGIFVGVRRRSGEFWVAVKEGGVRAVKTVRRIPEERRWGSDNRNWVKHVPWNKYNEDPDADGAIPEEKC